MEMEHWKKIDYYRNNLQLCRNGQTLSEMLPKNWSKFGEIYVTGTSQIYFLCSVCMEYAEHFRQVFSSCDSRDFLKHLQKQHGIELSTDTTNSKGSIRRQNQLKALSQSLLKSLVRPPHVTSETMALACTDETVDSGRESIEGGNTSDEFTLSNGEGKEEISVPEFSYLIDNNKVENAEMKSLRNDVTGSGHGLNNNNHGMEQGFWNQGGSSSVCCGGSNGRDVSSSRKVSARPFKCDVCGKRTLSMDALKKHKIRFHGTESSNGGTVACHICQKTVLRNNIHQHMLVHTNLRYFCPCCTSSYKQKQTLTLHMKRFHMDRMDLIPLYPLDSREVEARRLAMRIAQNTL